MEQSKKPDPKILITRYLSGEATIQEAEELQNWVLASTDNALYYNQLKNIWEGSDRNRMFEAIDTPAAFEAVKRKMKIKSRSAGILSWWNKIAAILLIPVLIGNVLYWILKTDGISDYHEQVYNEIYAVFGTRSALRLSDGTSVWLNSGSSIKYPDRFTGDDRTVYLHGEAYFEVKSNPEKPFIVKSDRLSTKATGTKFVVSDYTSSCFSEVTLVEGRIDVNRTDSSANPGYVTTLKPHQHLSFNNKTGDTTMKSEDTYKYFAWKDGKIIFRNEPLSRVVEKLGQVYNVEIEIKGEEIENYRYRATFQDESLEEILKLLSISSPIEYFETKRHPLPDGSFPKKKITIIPSRKQGGAF
ncbi:MAG TPA: FecR domain-containing protein [Bacteroidales bacterium]|nr:FecR domain-containing protein [Bacteroidales bacterium]